MPLTKLGEFLDSRHIKYRVISHSIAYTAQGIAALVHLSGKKLAKAMIVKIDGILAMAVVPASVHVDLDLLRAATGAGLVEFATEQEFKTRSPTARPARCRRLAMSTICRLMRMRVLRGTRRSHSTQARIAN